MILLTVEETPPEKREGAASACVLSCSGCSRAGELADHTARLLGRRGVAKMSCLAGVGGRVKSILNTVQSAPELLMIDGCPLECGARTLRNVGIEHFKHMKLHEYGIKKHSSEVSEQATGALAQAAERLLREPRNKNSLKPGMALHAPA